MCYWQFRPGNYQIYFLLSVAIQSQVCGQGDYRKSAKMSNWLDKQLNSPNLYYRTCKENGKENFDVESYLFFPWGTVYTQSRMPHPLQCNNSQSASRSLKTGPYKLVWKSSRLPRPWNIAVVACLCDMKKHYCNQMQVSDRRFQTGSTWLPTFTALVLRVWFLSLGTHTIVTAILVDAYTVQATNECNVFTLVHI